MRTWSVRSKGKLEKIIIFYFFLFMILIAVLRFASTRSSVGETSMDLIEVFVSFLLVLAPISIPLLVIPLKKLLTSKVPKEITFDKHRNLIIMYSKRSQDFIPLDNLAYSNSALSGYSISLTFYKKFVGSRGQTVYNEVIQLIGMKWTLSWRTDQLKELIGYLHELGIEKKRSANEDLNLFDKLSS